MAKPQRVARRRPTARERRFFVWLVAFAIMFESFLQAGEAVLDARLDKTILWASGALGLFALALVIEGYKARFGG